MIAQSYRLRKLMRGRFLFSVHFEKNLRIQGNNMETEQLESLATKRLVIGYLGEREQFGWWQSSFFTQGSDSFLSPLFGRTQLLAQYNGVSRSAALIHDERIGVGNVYHLFRLPEDVEQGLHQILHSSELEKRIREIITSKEAAISFLREQSKDTVSKNVGPTRVGNVKQLRNPKTWQTISGLYLSAIEKSLEIFPYFSDTA